MLSLKCSNSVRLDWSVGAQHREWVSGKVVIKWSPEILKTQSRSGLSAHGKWLREVQLF